MQINDLYQHERQDYERQSLITKYIEDSSNHKRHYTENPQGQKYVQLIPLESHQHGWLHKKSKSVYPLKINQHLEYQINNIEPYHLQKTSKHQQKKHDQHTKTTDHSKSLNIIKKRSERLYHFKMINTMMNDFNRQKTKTIYAKSKQSQRTKRTQPSLPQLDQTRYQHYSKSNKNGKDGNKKSAVEFRGYLDRVNYRQQAKNFPLGNIQIIRRVQKLSRDKIRGKFLQKEPLLLIQYRQIIEYRHKRKIFQNKVK